MKYDAIVIGSGIGGLASSVLLAAKGKKTLMLEKLNVPGGRLSSKNRDGFIVDFGVHLISRSYKGPYGEILRRAGRESKVKFVTVRPITNFDGKSFKFPHDLKSIISAEDYEGLMRCLTDIYAMSEDDLGAYDTMSMQTFLDMYTTEPIVHACINNVGLIYCGEYVFDLSAAEFMRCLRYERQEHASGYPLGGCISMVNELIEVFEGYGGEFRLGSGVEKIVIEGNKAKGVMVDGEFIEADAIIANSDLKATVLDLVGPEYFPQEYIEYIEDLRWNTSTCVVRMALDEKITDLQMLTIVGPTDIRQYAADLKSGREPESLYMFSVVPSNFDSNVAPEGKQYVCYCCAIPRETPADFRNKMGELMTRTIEKYIPGIRDHVIWEEFTQSSEIAASLGEGGAGIGMAQSVGQTGAFRPPNECSIENLFFVSAEAGGRGCATEMSMTSALECIEKHF